MDMHMNTYMEMKMYKCPKCGNNKFLREVKLYDVINEKGYPVGSMQYKEFVGSVLRCTDCNYSADEKEFIVSNKTKIS